VQNFIKLLQEGKAWETEADAEPGEKATGVGSTSKANGDAEPGGKIASVGSTGKANSGLAGKAAGAEKPGPAGKTVGAERSRPAGKAAYAETKCHDEDGGNIADQLPEIYREWASTASQITRNTTIRLSWSRARIHHSARHILLSP
jgi:hypothetical protein